jgi:hypothetical protein
MSLARFDENRDERHHFYESHFLGPLLLVRNPRREGTHPVRHQNFASFLGHILSTVRLMCCAITPTAPSWGGSIIVTTIQRCSNCNPCGNWGCDFAHLSKTSAVTGLMRCSPLVLFIRHTLSNRQYFNPAMIRDRSFVDPFFGKEMSKKSR